MAVDDQQPPPGTTIDIEVASKSVPAIVVEAGADDGPKPESTANTSPPLGISQTSGPGEEYNDPITALEAEVDPVYGAKARVLNRAIQEIGMGWYQWQLFVVVGFGWASDNLWPVVTSLIFTPVANEFRPSHAPLLTLAQNIGLLAGAVFWGFGCDMFGRRLAFNLTLGVTALFGLVAAGAPTFAGIGAFTALWSFGVGGNLPVDSAIFLEFLPGSHQFLLTLLSADWAIASVVANLIAWPLLGNMTCQERQAECARADNMGWRYFLIATGGITMLMFALRFLLFTIHESPKYLMGRGRDEDAVRVVHEVARRNGKVCTLTLADLQACEPDGWVFSQKEPQQQRPRGAAARSVLATTLPRHLEVVRPDRVRKLFATRRLALSTGITMTVWALIGLGYPLYNAFLPYIQATRGASFGDGSTYLTYRNSLIISVLGIPGALVGSVLVETPHLGRKGTLALSTLVTGALLEASTTATNSNALLAYNCCFSFTSNIMYAVLYTLTPELFPTPQRGTGNALTAASNRVFGIMAPLIAIFSNLETAVPVYTSGALFLAAGFLVLVLPFESRGKAAL